MGASIAQQRKTSELVAEAQRLRFADMSISDIARQLGISRPYASHLLSSSHSRIVVAAREAWKVAHPAEVWREPLPVDWKLEDSLREAERRKTAVAEPVVHALPARAPTPAQQVRIAELRLLSGIEQDRASDLRSRGIDPRTVPPPNPTPRPRPAFRTGPRRRGWDQQKFNYRRNS